MSDKEMNLLPCPFCGRSISIISNRDWHRISAFDHADNCILADDIMPTFPATEEGMRDLIEVWNTRHTPAVRGLDAELLLQHLVVEQAKILRLYPSSAYGTKKLVSRLKIFIKDGEFNTPAPDSLARYRERLVQFANKMVSGNGKNLASDAYSRGFVAAVAYLTEAIESGELEK
jgi:hypothetical protein